MKNFGRGTAFGIPISLNVHLSTVLYATKFALVSIGVVVVGMIVVRVIHQASWLIEDFGRRTTICFPVSLNVYLGTVLYASKFVLIGISIVVVGMIVIRVINKTSWLIEDFSWISTFGIPVSLNVYLGTVLYSAKFVLVSIGVVVVGMLIIRVINKTGWLIEDFGRRTACSFPVSLNVHLSTGLYATKFALVGIGVVVIGMLIARVVNKTRWFMKNFGGGTTFGIPVSLNVHLCTGLYVAKFTLVSIGKIIGGETLAGNSSDLLVQFSLSCGGNRLVGIRSIVYPAKSHIALRKGIAKHDMAIAIAANLNRARFCSLSRRMSIDGDIGTIYLNLSIGRRLGHLAEIGCGNAGVGKIAFTVQRGKVPIGSTGNLVGLIDNVFCLQRSISQFKGFLDRPSKIRFRDAGNRFLVCGICQVIRFLGNLTLLGGREIGRLRVGISQVSVGIQDGKIAGMGAFYAVSLFFKFFGGNACRFPFTVLDEIGDMTHSIVKKVYRFTFVGGQRIDSG